MSVMTGLAVAVAAAVVITVVRSDAIADSAKPGASAVSSSAVSTGRQSAAVVTVPPLSAGTVSSGDAGAGATGAGAAGASAAGEAAASSKDSAARQSAASVSSAAAARAANAAAAKAAAAKAAAEKVAAAKAAASSSAAASSAAAASAASSSAAAASASAASAASSSASAASSSSSASRSAAQESASAAAHPAADTTEAVDEAVTQAADRGVNQSVIVMNRQTGSVTTSVDADAEVPSMSLVKLFLAADVIDRAGGVAEVDADTLAQLEQMISTSDDSIAQDFYDQDGRSDIITRVSQTYGLTGTTPAPEPRYWGGVRITARDMASFLFQVLGDPDTGLWFAQAMQASTDTGADGFDQAFGVNALFGAGSKQGWGCCLAGVLAIHSVGFTANQIIVVLSTSEPDASHTLLATASQLTSDPGAQLAVAAATRTAAAAVG